MNAAIDRAGGMLANIPAGQRDEDRSSDSECLFYSEAQTALLIGIHRTTLRTLALEGKSPVEAIHVTDHRRVYRKRDVHRLAGLVQ